MADGKAPKNKARTGDSREDRLKSALKANMARRKAQARARAQAGREENGDQRGNAPLAQDKED